jgi:hypothetical protein
MKNGMIDKALGFTVVFAALVGFAGPLSAEPIHLRYSTYLGGAELEERGAIAVDAEKCAYVAGYTESPDFPIVNPYQASDGSGYISKLSSTGSFLIYSTFLGGTHASSVCVENGEAYVAGWTTSTYFPVVNAYQPSLNCLPEWQSNAFVTRLSSEGSSLIYSTYLGGWYSDKAFGIAVTGGEAYVCGAAKSYDFPTLNPYQASMAPYADSNIFITRFSSSGSCLVYSTYLGGTAEDKAYSIGLENREVYICGSAGSRDFPTVNPYRAEHPTSIAYTSFVAKLSSSGSSLLYSTYLGGNIQDDTAYGIAVKNGYAYVTGCAQSLDFPTVNPYQEYSDVGGTGDAFVSKLSTSGSSLVYSTFLGGEYVDQGEGVSVESGCAYVTGYTRSSSFPTVNPYQASKGWLTDDYDAFITQLSTSGSSLVFSTYLGGTGMDFGGGNAVRNAEVYITGQTRSRDFPTFNPYQPSRADLSESVGDVFISKLSLTTPSANPWIYDYNGDGTSDIAIFRGSSGMWSVKDITRVYLGNSTDSLVPADYNGDGTTDIAIFRENGGMWSVRNLTRFYLGAADDQPVPGDYNGDGIAEAGIFRPSSGMWSIRDLTRVYLGAMGDTVIPGFYNSDAAKNIAIFRGSTGMWSVKDLTRFYLGASTDDLVPGDYNGAGQWEGGIFRPSSGMWSIRNVTRVYLGSANDWALPADYNGDGVDDAGIFRDTAGMWSIRSLTRVYFGGTGDIPVTR